MSPATENIPVSELHVRAPVPSTAMIQDSNVDWPSILAGTLVALALSILLLLFGSSIGLTFAPTPAGEGAALTTIGLSGAVWFALVHIHAIGVGSYISGRLRPRSARIDNQEVTFRDGANGLVVWALAIVLSVMIANSAIATASKVVTGVASNTTAAVTVIAEQSVDQIFTGASAAPASNAAALTENERERVVGALRRGLASGTLAARDRAYLEGLLARKTGMTAEQAKAWFDEVVTPATKQAITVIEDIKQATALAGFWSVFVMLLSGLAAWWAGAFGGSHRDETVRDRDV